ncbi:MAG: hypothetical protein R3231_09480 [bacterium]|nr:hypothetical protein [bacterium]
MMKKHKIVLLGAFILFLTTQNVGADVRDNTIVVIVNPESPIQSLTLDQVEALYRNDVRYWPDGQMVHLYDMEVDAKARLWFSQSLLQSTPERVERDWMQRTMVNEFMGVRKKVVSPAAMQERVARDRRAVGYLLKRDLRNEKVRIVATVD